MFLSLSSEGLTLARYDVGLPCNSQVKSWHSTHSFFSQHRNLK